MSKPVTTEEARKHKAMAPQSAKPYGGAVPRTGIIDSMPATSAEIDRKVRALRILGDEIGFIGISPSVRVEV